MAPTKPAEELYDITTDPNELTNLAASTRYQTTLVNMRHILTDWVQKTNDQGQYPEKKSGYPTKKAIN